MDSGLDISEGLIQLCLYFVVSQFGKKCGFNNPALFRREDLEGISQDAILLIQMAGLVRGIRRSLWNWTVHIVGKPFFSIFEREQLDRPDSRYVRITPDDRPSR